MRLRRKLTIAFFGVSSLLSVLLALFLYRFIERQLGAELRGKLKDVTHIGTYAIDRGAYQRLVDQLGDDKRVADVERSADYQRLSDELNTIRNAEPQLIHFVYVLAPTANPDKPRFVADADVLALSKRQAAGEKLGENEGISHFSQEYDVSAIPLLKEALAACDQRDRVENELVYDEEFGVSSVSSYIPLRDDAGRPLRGKDGRCLGVLGVDITDQDMRAALAKAGGLALWLSLAVVALALVVSIAMGTVLTRSIHALSLTVKRFADNDTVNTASRMESSGVPGRVQVTETTYQLLKGQFELEERGPIEVKGKGTMTTYLLVA